MASISSLGIGSGLDLSGLLDQLESAERQKLTPIARQQQSYQTKISAFGLLESALDKVKDAAAALSDAEDFADVETSLSGEALTISAGEGAIVGNYEIDVTQRARSYSIATLGVADKEAQLGGGSIEFTLGNGETLSVAIDEADSSLEDVRNAINSADAGIVASIVNDGSGTPYRLVLSSAESGTEAAIANIDFTGDLGASLALDAATEVEAKNAQLTVNGIAIQSQNNRVEGAIEGITLDLEKTGTATLEVTRDTDGIEKKLTSFVDAYNDLQERLSDLTKFNTESGVGGVLQGNATVRSIESQMRNLLGGSLESDTFSSLADLGITLEIDGTLTLDEEKVDDLVSNRLGELSRFFAGTSDDSDGFADRIESVLGAMTEEDGLLETATSGLEASIASTEDRYARVEAQIASTIERYRTQFSQLDSLIAQMNSTSTYLTQQFEALAAQTQK
ncbi:flagellar filament capping protein FliD [Microbulbifer harenosus]|uniref:Flagellar hook-associated protein 2 n=1 Tax=Microbulbifer harenosus TaxID=2576840 RepID=A0ABY2UMY8_9GAMM|nr:flagellar filament capping protein FliD [Microbulbifer harenosus]TLM79983.1 flagellar hook protein [Microbulbifer harenosus]